MCACVCMCAYEERERESVCACVCEGFVGSYTSPFTTKGSGAIEKSIKKSSKLRGRTKAISFIYLYGTSVMCEPS